jgi:uncharacterized C2H2 Zn-finger protein
MHFLTTFECTLCRPSMISLSKLKHCPECGTLWQDKPIPKESQWLFGGDKWFSRLIAISSWQRDRCIAYQCPDCHTCWDRDTGAIIDSYDLSIK